MAIREMLTQVPVPLSTSGLVFKLARYTGVLYNRLSRTPVSVHNHVKGDSDYLPIYPTCGAWLEEESWSLLSDEAWLQRLETRPW